MHPNARLIQSFYEAFQRRDAEAMAACYHPDIHFSDPVFLDLHGPMASNMWRMLLSNKSSDLSLTFRDVRADDGTGSAHWDASYTFSTGRKVLNRIDSAFTFKDGKIIRQADTFDLWRWTRMALGPAGMLLGWTPFLQSTVRRNARARLDKFVADLGAKAA